MAEASPVSACPSWTTTCARRQASPTAARRGARPPARRRRSRRRGSRPRGRSPRAIAAAIALGRRVVEVHAAAGAVALEPVADVEVLLEVVAQREVEERPLLRGQLHRGRQAALHDRQVAGGQVPVEVVDVGHDLEPCDVRAATRGRCAGPATTIMRSSGTRSLAVREGGDHPAQQVAADARAADGDDADPLVVAVAELVAQLARGRRGRRGRSRSRSR